MAETEQRKQAELAMLHSSREQRSLEGSRNEALKLLWNNLLGVWARNTREEDDAD